MVEMALAVSLDSGHKFHSSLYFWPKKTTHEVKTGTIRVSVSRRPFKTLSSTARLPKRHPASWFLNRPYILNHIKYQARKERARPPDKTSHVLHNKLTNLTERYLGPFSKWCSIKIENLFNWNRKILMQTIIEAYCKIIDGIQPVGLTLISSSFKKQPYY